MSSARRSAVAPTPGVALGGRGVVVVWVARVAWLAAAVVGGSAVGAALDERSRAVQLTGTIGAWVGFAAGALTLVVASTATLTAARAVVPAGLGVTVATAVGGAEALGVLALGVTTGAASAAVASAEFGRVYLQASAYGDEQRFGLRPPVGYLVLAVGTWLLLVTAVIVAPLALAAGALLVGVIAAAVALAGGWLFPRRWHQLSRRWFVLVPAGAVVHDPVVLGETLLAPRPIVESVELDDVGAGRHRGTDLTGPTPGLAVEVRLRQPLPALINPTLGARGGEVASVTSYVVSPTRPGAVVRAAAAAGLGTAAG